MRTINNSVGRTAALIGAFVGLIPHTAKADDLARRLHIVEIIASTCHYDIPEAYIFLVKQYAKAFPSDYVEGVKSAEDEENANKQQFGASYCDVGKLKYDSFISGMQDLPK